MPSTRSAVIRDLRRRPLDADEPAGIAHDMDGDIVAAKEFAHAIFLIGRGLENGAPPADGSMHGAVLQRLVISVEERLMAIDESRRRIYSATVQS